ncbi:MAG: phosphoribosylformylglycinamidine synthase subunit PurS [Acidobacteriia bacterium]|nr:phosphoribosylformylglycinamidine synthase subunit PurS [Terriglobia bacterium]
MKAEVIVSLKKTVLDPQGKAIHHAIESLGFRSVTEVRQGKVFEIQLTGIQDEATAREEVERIAREVLTNPVIEEFSFILKN